MNAMDWWRSWHGAPTDMKWLAIAARAQAPAGMVSALAWALLDHASQANERGSITGFDLESYAAYSGFDEEALRRIVEAMRDKGIITDDDRMAAWEKRQPKREDSSAERVRRYRKRKARQDAVAETQEGPDDGSVTQCNAGVTQCNASDDSATDGNAPEESRGEKSRGETSDRGERSLLAIYQDLMGETGNPPPRFRQWFADVTGRYSREACILAFRRTQIDLQEGNLGTDAKWERAVHHLQNPVPQPIEISIPAAALETPSL